jgi:Amt family ammonium transporter
VLDSGDTAWVLTSSALVLMMTLPGLALFYGGLVRAKNVLNILVQCFFCAGVIGVLWILVGYSLAFSGTGSFVGDLGKVGLAGVGLDSLTSNYASPPRAIPEYVFIMFQAMFAIITPGLIIGAVAERMKFSVFVAFITLWVLVVYCPLAHMVWGKGGLLNATLGGRFPALDFAGGTVVHISSGVSALVAALVLGKRLGFGTEPIIPHNLTMTMTGTGLLWFGWFGFNAGSAVAAGGLAASAFVVTHFAAAAATLSWTFAEWIWRGKPSALGAVSGAVAGLVAITPASGYVGPMASLFIGGAAGVICFWSTSYVKNKFGYDDSLDAFGVHGVGGTVGALLTGVFASKFINPGATDGLLHGNPGQLLNQFIAVAVTWLFAIVMTFIIIKVVDLVIGLRLNPDDEIEGLDSSQHGESGYNLEA